jgi:hypothetical protein
MVCPALKILVLVDTGTFLLYQDLPEIVPPGIMDFR